MSKETLDFINEGFAKAKGIDPSLDYESFLKGAEYIINHLINKGRL